MPNLASDLSLRLNKLTFLRLAAPGGLSPTQRHAVIPPALRGASGVLPEWAACRHNLQMRYKTVSDPMPIAFLGTEYYVSLFSY